MSNEDEVTSLGTATIARIDSLIDELESLTTAWRRKLEASTKLERREQPDTIPGLHDFIVSVKGTRNSVQRLLKARAASQQGQAGVGASFDREERDNKDRAVIQGCGLAPHQEQWDAIKRARGLLAFRRRFAGKSGELGPTIDAVVENGTEWLKISTVTEKKLIYQMAQEGWHPDDSSDDDESDDSDDENSGISIVKTTKQLVEAARMHRCNTRIPTIRLVLPNLTLRRVHAVDKILERTRSLGLSKKQEGDVEVIVDCADGAFLQRPIPSLDQVFTGFFCDTNQDRLTSTVNLELTIILSLVSDIAHAEAEPKEWYSRQTLSHIEDENHAPGVRLQNVYAALGDRRLQCTQEVAREVRNVVDDLGTETTKTRALIFFGRRSLRDGFDIPRSHTIDTSEKEGLDREVERQRLVEQLRKLSRYPVPDNLQLPIEIVGDDEFNHKNYQALIDSGQLPPVAAKVWEKLDRSYNRSCHLWGWLQDITTVSANNLNAKLIDATVDKERTSALELGPRLYLTTLAISINTAKPCPSDKWEEIKDAKHERREARTKEAKQMKAAGTWGPSLGIPVKWDERQLKKQYVRRKKNGGEGGGANGSGISTPSTAEEVQ
ncbi:hypothetical protein M406DRAFT_106124 [Cryphonectria parasitica EP155]|uniref:DUF1308 domain-containing protein n=1 Tax=Cryphonectria parasitica (strain ATCC 38755 / EP155) TaxID=660469 RepID=A0A9P4Y3X2_CRYP1|nr:uncharacterized protein M406DRAFT_106124 [Cryphonectria parasitica EP155]KAF3766171.1 hypothetical protein M406DRAFT_106124 [Cryphonectria parasitica EP155]